MIERNEPRHDAGAAPAFQMRTTIDAAAFARIHAGLVDALHGLLMAGRIGKVPDERVAAIQKRYADRVAHVAWVYKALPWLSAGGLALALLVTPIDDSGWDIRRLDWGVTLFFAAMLALSFPLRRLPTWKPTPPYWLVQQKGLRKVLARLIAARMVRTARKHVPFEAHYEIDGATITYRRVTAAGTVDVWHGTIGGWRVPGSGFTLLMKDRTSLEAVFIMHEPCAAFDALLARHGVEPMPQP